MMQLLAEQFHVQLFFDVVPWIEKRVYVLTSYMTIYGRSAVEQNINLNAKNNLYTQMG